MGIFGDLASGIFGLGGDSGAGEAKDWYQNELLPGYTGLNPNAATATAAGDTRSRAAQMSALDQLQNIYSKGGLDPIALSQISEANQAARTSANQGEQQIQQQARQMGAGNMGGVGFALEQGAGQNASNQAAQATRGAAAEAEQRQRGAIGQAGQLATATGQQANQLAEYNAGQANLMAQQNYQNQLQRLAGMGGAYGAGYAAQNTGYGQALGAWGKLGGAGDSALSGLASYLGGV